MVRQNKIWIFKSYTQMVVSIILFILFIIGFIYIGTIDFKKDEITDNQRFKEEHQIVSENNVYTYVNATQVYDYLKGNNAIILFGIKNSKWVSYYADILNNVAINLGIDKIYYYDITDDRIEENATYQSIVNYLSNNLTYLDDGTLNIYAATLIIKKNNKIIYFDDETALIKGNIKPDDYWDEIQKYITSENIKLALNEYLGSENGKEQ